jgi:hypothetical protein
MIKIIEFNINEILMAERACSELITRACLRTPVTPRHVTGLCSSEDKVFVILEDCPEDIPLPEYRFAFLSSVDKDEVGAEITLRYYAGFTTIGSFVVEDKLWALFARGNTGNDA